jgi:DNA-binding transcriptional LysR family regulator
MHDEHIATLAGIDLNLLVVLDALLSAGGATRAAARLSLSQSTVSHALGRLRQALGDPLLVRTPRGLVPTPRAEALQPTLHRLLQELGAAVKGAPDFDPATDRASFTLAMSDYVSLLVMPPLMSRLAAEAPGLSVLVRSISNDEAAALERGDIDLCIGRLIPARQGLYQQTLFSDRLLCMVAAERAPAKSAPAQSASRRRRPFTLKEYLARRHVLISPQGQGPGIVDLALAEQGLSRDIALRVPYFMTAPLIVARTDLVLTLPERVAKVLSRMLPVRLVSPPLPLREFSMVQAWHERHHASPRHVYLRRLISEIGRKL